MQINSPVVATNGSSWLTKCIQCFFGALAIVNTLLLAAEFLPVKVQSKLGRSFYTKLLPGQLYVGLLFGIIYSIYWHRKEIKNAINSYRLHALFIGILRYWLAFQIATYGFAKIFKTQFHHSFQASDTLAGDMNGFSITWYYFSYSYTFAVILGLLQIAGSTLLLFRRTVLLGVAVLLPVMVNILFINYFYRIAAGAFLNSILFSLGLLYLLLLRWKDLKKIFFHAAEVLPSLQVNKLAWLLKLLPVTAAFLIVYILASRYKTPGIAGKWKVDTMIRDGDTVKPGEWLTDSRVWSTIYLEDYDQMSICANPYFFDKSRNKYGTYSYDTSRKSIQLVFWSTRDTVHLTVAHYNGHTMEWRGLFENDTTVIFLSRAIQQKPQDNY